MASSEKWTFADLLLPPSWSSLVAVEYFSLKARLTISSLVSAFVGAAAAREMVATDVKEEGGEGEGGGGEEEWPLKVDVVEEEEEEEAVCFVGWREVRDRGQQKRSW